MKISGNYTTVKKVTVDVDTKEVYYVLLRSLKRMFPEIVFHNREFRDGKVYETSFNPHKNEVDEYYMRDSSDDEKKFEEYREVLKRVLSDK